MSSAALVRQARSAAGLTQAELAARAGTSQSVIARLERRGSNPTVATLERVLNAAGQRLETVPVAAASDDAQLRERLSMSPAERLAMFQASQRNLEALLAKARRVHP